MKTDGKMKLVLEDGREFAGIGCGAASCAVGEIVFNTSMVGYQEILSDPGYAGQIVVMTYPLIGQYRIMAEDYESRLAGPAALVVRECCGTPSNFRYTKTLSEELEDHGIPCIQGIDTRMLTRAIRERGTMKAAVVGQSVSTEEALKMIASVKEDPGLMARVSCNKRWFSRTPQHSYDVVVLDCGVKHSTVAALNRLGCNVTVVPFNTGAAEILAFEPDGVIVAGGPCDPAGLGSVVRVLGELRGRLPLYGIGLGHILIAMSYGAVSYRMRCGHHGGRAVRNVLTNRITTSEHNHGYAVDEVSVGGTGLSVLYRDVADGTVEGLVCESDRVRTAQFYPEGGPGPQETDFFESFVALMEE